MSQSAGAGYPSDVAYRSGSLCCRILLLCGGNSLHRRHELRRVVATRLGLAVHGVTSRTNTGCGARYTSRCALATKEPSGVRNRRCTSRSTRWDICWHSPSGQLIRRPRQVARLAERVQQITGSTVELAYVDQGYTGTNAADAAQRHGMQLEVVKHHIANRGFVLLPRRRVVERSFTWAARSRRLAHGTTSGSTPRPKAFPSPSS